jgi:hypothetical protein
MSKILPKCRGQGRVRDVSTWPIVGKPFAALPTRSYRIREAGISKSDIARFGASLNQYCASGARK